MELHLHPEATLLACVETLRTRLRNRGLDAADTERALDIIEILLVTMDSGISPQAFLPAHCASRSGGVVLDIKNSA